MESIPTPRRTISGKLDRLVVLSVGVSLLVAGLLSVWHEAERYLESRRETMLATAQVFGAATSKAVGRGDAAAVTEAIRAVARLPGLVRAEVEDRRGSVLAAIGNAIRLGDDLDLDEGSRVSPLRLLASRTVAVSVPVVESGEQVGRLSLVSDTADLGGRFAGALLSALAGPALALALGLVLARRLRRAITTPIAALAAAMADVERTGSLAPVPCVGSDDETGYLAARFNGMIGEVRRATDEILAREDEIIGRLSRAAEQRDDQTGQHVVRVARISRIIGRRLGLDPAYLDELCRASPMHDVGKISVPDAILFKPGRLDEEERRTMERHAEAGHRILSGSRSKLVQLAAEVALTHHERWDGAGYPNRLGGAEIPLSGRITAVADVCDALLSVRPYKRPWSLESVKAHLAAQSGTHFDPACVAALMAAWPELEAVYRDQPGEPEALAA